jgi:hypothetical protein
MAWLMVLFVPPLYLLLQKKPLAAIFNLILCILAGATIFLFGIGLLFWALAIGHASWHMRKQLMRENAEIIAEKMAAKLVEKKIELIGIKNEDTSSRVSPENLPPPTTAPELPVRPAPRQYAETPVVRAEPKFCEDCGVKVDDDSKFCSDCGALIAV